MGLLGDSQTNGGGNGPWSGLRSLVRRKQVDSIHARSRSGHQLAKELSVLHLIAIGNYLFHHSSNDLGISVAHAASFVPFLLFDVFCVF